jgi:ATP-binding cassette subfamily B multidrug efflux pump
MNDMSETMFSWFEKRLDPFPPAEPVEPPRTLWAFCWHFTRPAWPFVTLAALLTALIAVIEVWLFGFLGQIVDWLSAQSRETFLQTEWWKLAGMALVAGIVLPGLVALSSLNTYQTLFGNYPMRIRWQVHRYLLKQSMAFYQDEFAGRIATKLMQTALAVRETVIKFAEVLNYVVVYFLGMLVIGGLAAGGAACGVAGRLRPDPSPFCPASWQGVSGAGGRPLGDDGAHCRQLHQYPDGEAVLARAP